jgi:hypothetical protein
MPTENNLSSFFDEDGLIQSPEAQEVIGRPPGRILRYGITVIFLSMVALLFICWFISYPDILKAKVTITTSPPPITLVTRSSGVLELFRKEKDVVNAGNEIGLILNNTDYLSVKELEEALKTFGRSGTMALGGSLGDLEQPMTEYLKACEALKFFDSSRTFSKQIAHLTSQRNSYMKLGKSLSSQSKLSKQEFLLATEKFNVDSLLYSQKVLTRLDFNQAKTVWIQQLRNYKTSETNLINNEITLSQIEKQLLETENMMIAENRQLKLDSTRTAKELVARISKWKDSYLLKSPIDGTVALLGFYEKGQFVESNTALATILPNGSEIIGRAELPVAGSGKVKKGQRVNISLDNFPFEQYGKVQGIISDISLVPGKENYRVTISLPKKLKTTQNQNLEFKQELTGVTEIITEDLRLLERFIYEMRKLIKRR